MIDSEVDEVINKAWAKETIECADDIGDGHEELEFMMNSLLSQFPDKPELIYDQLH